MTARWNSADLARKMPQERTKPAHQPTTPAEPREPVTAKKTEPRHWVVGELDIRKTTTIDLSARVVLIYPDADWPRLLAHLKSFTP